MVDRTSSSNIVQSIPSLATTFYSTKELSDKLVIVSNALCADQDSYPIYKRFATEAAECGFNVLTYDYSGRGKSPGRQEDATITSHINDLSKVIMHYRDYGLQGGLKPKIVLVGHSLGGVVSTNNHYAVEGIVLWNSPIDLLGLGLYSKYAQDIKDKGYTTRKRGDKEVIVGKDMWEEFATIKHDMIPFKENKVYTIIGEKDYVLNNMSLKEYVNYMGLNTSIPVTVIPGENDHDLESNINQKLVIEKTIDILNTIFYK